MRSGKASGAVLLQMPRNFSVPKRMRSAAIRRAQYSLLKGYTAFNVNRSSAV